MFFRICVAVLCGFSPFAAYADTLNDCGITDAQYTAAIEAYDARGLRDNFVESIPESVFNASALRMNRLMDQDPGMMKMLGEARKFIPLQRKLNKPPKWVGDRITGMDRLETAAEVYQIFGLFRSFSHAALAPPAVVELGEPLSQCAALSRKNRKKIVSFAQRLPASPAVVTVYTDRGVSSDFGTLMIEEFGSYANAKNVVSRAANAPFLDVTSDDVCRDLNRRAPSDEGGGWEVDDDSARTQCVYSLLGGAGFTTAAGFNHTEYSAEFFPLLKVGGAAEARGGVRVEDQAFADLLIERLQARQPSSVEAAFRVLSLAGGKDSERILRLMRENFADSGRTMAQEFGEFYAGETGSQQRRDAMREAGRRSFAQERQLKNFEDLVIRAARKNRGLLRKITPLALPLSAIQANGLRANEAIFVLDQSSHLSTSYAITQGGVFAANSSKSLTEIRALTDQITASIEAYVVGAPHSDYPMDVANEIYNATIAPVGEGLVGVQRVYILANEASQNIPFEALIARLPGSDSPAWWGNDVEIVQIPSLNSLIELRKNYGKLPTLKIFSAVSDPSFSGALAASDTNTALYSLGASFDPVETPCALPRVRATGRIAEQLSKRFTHAEGSNLRGAAATEAAVRALADSGAFAAADVVSFNTHGLLGGQMPKALGRDPALAFLPSAEGCSGSSAPPEESGDGFLTAAEIYSLNMHAPLVLLMACNTIASGGVEASAPLTGLARAFFAAGAGALIVSKWDALVADDIALIAGPTEMFMEALFDPANEILPLARRVQFAKAKVRETYPHPAAWAVFSLVGAGD